MQNKAIIFTSFEKEIMRDRQWMLAKREVITKTESIFAKLQQQIDKRYAARLEQLSARAGISFQSPKISKGENYRGLPYVVLDCPRYYSGEQMCSFRTVFWWGHHYSFSLLLRGRPWDKLKPQLKAKELFSTRNAWLVSGPDAFTLEYAAENYFALPAQPDTGKLNTILEKPYFRISRPMGLEATEEEIIEQACEAFESFTAFFP